MSALNKLASLLNLFDQVPLANRNLFVDGAFDFWTGSSGAISGGYSLATMWIAGPGTGGAATFGYSDIHTYGNPSCFDSSPRVCFSFQQTTASTGTLAARTLPFLVQNVEGVQRLSGKSATVSFKLWVASGSITIPGIAITQAFGSGGSPSANVTADKAVNWVVTTTPKRFSVRLDVPSVAGKTIGTNTDGFLQVGLWLPPGVTFTLYGVEAQLEQANPNASSDINGAGGAPTAFEYRGQQAEYARTQRYYEVITTTGIVTCYAAGSAAITGWNSFAVTKRAAPSVSVVLNGGGLSGASTAPNNTSANGLAVLQTGGSMTLGQSNFISVTCTADARL
jgi:hypothetical protein